MISISINERFPTQFMVGLLSLCNIHHYLKSMPVCPSIHLPGFQSENILMAKIRGFTCVSWETTLNAFSLTVILAFIVKNCKS